MSNISNNKLYKDEITIKYLVDFFVDFWKSILTMGVVGLLGAFCYILVTPNEYEAVAQIKLARIESKGDANPLGINLEDANILIARLKMPSAYSPKEFNSCNLLSRKYPAEALVSMVKVSVIKGVASIVELKIRSDSKEQAISCVQAIFENIRESQAQIIAPYIEDAKATLLQYKNRFEDVQRIVSLADKSGTSASVIYLYKIDELRFLSNEIIRLNAVIASGDTRLAKLVLPIYASDTPIFPKNKLVLLTGLLAGLLFGILFAFSRKFWQRYQS